MLFRNLKSGNLVDARDPDVIDMMSGSPNYERVAGAPETPSPPPSAAAEADGRSRKKTAGRTAKTAR